MTAQRNRKWLGRLRGWFFGGTVFLAAAMVSAVAGYIWAEGSKSVTAVAKTSPSLTDASNRSPHFVGSETCKGCHAAAYQAWSRSDHAAAMAVPSPQSVRGNFKNVQVELAGERVIFLKKSDGYHVRLPGNKGKGEHYRVAYTFGIEPLQQYLIESLDGSLQVLPYAWDSRPAKQGGQRWFVLEKATLDPHSPLYWQSNVVSWNHMCAGCHITGLEQQFDPETGQYQANWGELGVGCESCHGPASRHVAWAHHPRKSFLPNKGLVFNLDGSSVVDWVFAAGDPIANRVPSGVDRTEVETCGRCHSRRARVAADFHFGQPLADSYRISLLTEGLYFADGQQKAEVYEYGSFLQSAMYAAGVTCSNCHLPHSGELRLQANAVCTQCHRASVFDTPEHHHHEAGSRAGQCVSCHMPSRTYMGVDSRRDHGFRIPRPALSAELETPNACNSCHTEHSSQWAADWVEKLHNGAPLSHHYGEVLSSGRSWQAAAPSQLFQLANNEEQPAIVRATALKLLQRFPGQRLSVAAKRAAASDNALLRRAAANALPRLPARLAAHLANQLLRDDILTVRIEAARVLLRLAPTVTSRVDIHAWKSALAALRAGLEARRGSVESMLGLAALAQWHEAFQNAERLLRSALERRPNYAPAWINLADLLRRRGQPAQALQTLQQGLDQVPQAAALHYALGLALVRSGKADKAIAALARAWELGRGNPRYAYVYAVALHDTGHLAQALGVLKRSVERFPAHRNLAAALRDYAVEAGHQTQSLDAVMPEREGDVRAD